MGSGSDSTGHTDATATHTNASTPPASASPKLDRDTSADESTGSLVVHLARAVAAAAGEGRLDVMNELAVLLVRLGAEERQRVHREAGVVALDSKAR